GILGYWDFQIATRIAAEHLTQWRIRRQIRNGIGNCIPAFLAGHIYCCFTILIRWERQFNFANSRGDDNRAFAQLWNSIIGRIENIIVYFIFKLIKNTFYLFRDSALFAIMIMT